MWPFSVASYKSNEKSVSMRLVSLNEFKHLSQQYTKLLSGSVFFTFLPINCKVLTFSQQHGKLLTTTATTSNSFITKTYHFILIVGNYRISFNALNERNYTESFPINHDSRMRATTIAVAHFFSANTYNVESMFRAVKRQFKL